MKLLIADDEFIIRKGLLSLDWASIGVDQVYSAENGIQAKEYLENKEIDIVISDIKMPGLDGLQLSEYINQYSKETIIILLTGFGEFEYAQKAIRHNVFEYMLKPIRPDELFKVVMSAMKIIEQKKYQNRVVREHEEITGAFNSVEKIIYSFRDVNERILDILNYMANEYSREISLNDLAEKYHFTPVYLSRLIKKETGYSFIEILNAIRLMNAVELLYENKYKINIISDKTGFRDQRYFSQIFKKVFGCTPGDYKKNSQDIRIFTIKEILELISKRSKANNSRL